MKKIIIIAILSLSFVLRFWKLDSYPAFNADEAALGYNAYSLIKTGMDEHGNTWPIHFQSFNDYKPGGYVYLILPFVKFFGLNEWSVRIPNAFLGVLSVYVLYLLIKELKIDRSIKISNFELKISEIGAFMLAISPWHIHFSRGGWEVNTATFFIVFGLYLFLKFLSLRNMWYLAFSICNLVMSMYTYHAARLISPLLGMGLVIIYWKEISLIKNFKKIFPSIILFVVLLTPLIIDFTKGSVVSRAAGVGLLADPGPISRIEEQRSQHYDYRNLDAKILHNKLVNYGLAFFDNWTQHYHGLFLFLSGDDIQRDKVPETGQMYLLDLFFLLFGIWFMIKNYSQNSKSYLLVFYWLLIAPFAASLTFQSPHALRAQNMVIPLVVISAIGFSYLVNLFNIKNLRIVSWILVVIIVWSFTRYMHMYWIHMSKEYPFSSQYGVKELVAFLSRDEFRNRQIVVTDRYDQPYILFLYYLKYEPLKFQSEHSLTSRDGFGFSTVRDFDKYHFYSIKWDEMIVDYPNSLIVGTPEEIPDEANIVKRIYGSNGFEYFNVVAN